MNALLLKIRRMLIASATAESINTLRISETPSENNESEEKND